MDGRSAASGTDSAFLGEHLKHFRPFRQFLRGTLFDLTQPGQRFILRYPLQRHFCRADRAGEFSFRTRN